MPDQAQSPQHALDKDFVKTQVENAKTHLQAASDHLAAAKSDADVSAEHVANHLQAAISGVSDTLAHLGTSCAAPAAKPAEAPQPPRFVVEANTAAAAMLAPKTVAPAPSVAPQPEPAKPLAPAAVAKVLAPAPSVGLPNPVAPTSSVPSNAAPLVFVLLAAAAAAFAAYEHFVVHAF